MSETKVPVFAINLDASSDRWESLLRCALAFDLDLHRVSAIDGRAVEPEDWVGFDRSGFRHQTGRVPLPGEYGCYRSHLRALKTFIEHGAPHGVIIEDDVLPNGQTEARVNAIIAAMPDFDVVRLISHRSRGFINFLTTEHRDQIGRTVFGPQGSAAAYLVSREGAQKIVAALSIMSQPWDVALESFWANKTSTFSSKENVLDFSLHRSNSTIIAQNGYRDSKFRLPKRLGAIAFQLKESFIRAHHVLLAPKPALQRPPQGNLERPGAKGSPGSVTAFSGGALLMIFLSSVWLETDAYRYAGAIMVMAALIHYFRVDFFSYRKPLIGLAGLACAAWTIYVMLRMGHDYLVRPGKGIGASEGIYLLPLFYPSFGYALYLCAHKPFPLVATFMVISLGGLLFGTDFHHIFLIERAETTWHNNPIHAANVSGIMMICAVAFANYLFHNREFDRTGHTALIVVAAAVFAIAGLNVFALQSKGVWLALIGSLPLLFAMTTLDRRNRYGKIIVFAVLACVFAGTVLFGNNIRKAGESTMDNAASLVSRVVQGENLASIVSDAILDPNTPSSVSARLMNWSNAAEIWQKRPVFGSGLAWLDNWENRKYPESKFTLLHNGYLEIAVRYGIAGLAFYALLFLWSLRTVRKAVDASLIDRTAYHAYAAVMTFFAVSIFTNSNSRIAFGETYMWFAVSFAFYCQYRLQEIGLVRPNTYL